MLCCVAILCAGQYCDNPLLSNLNANAPLFQYRRRPSLINNNSYCGFLRNGLSCCQAGILEQQKELFDHQKKEFQGKNRVFVNQMNSNLMRSIYYSDYALNNVDNMNFYFQKLNDLQQSLQDIIDVQLVLNSNTSQTIDMLKQINAQLTVILDTEVINNAVFISQTKDPGTNFTLYYVNESLLQQDYWLQQQRLLHHVEQRSSCFSRLMEHLGSLSCLTCDPDHAQRGITINQTISDVFLKMDWSACATLQQSCQNYILSQGNVSQNSALFAYTMSQRSLNATLNSTNRSAITTGEIMNFFQQFILEINRQMTESYFYDIPEACRNSSDSCSYPCENYLESTEINAQNILQGNVNNLNLLREELRLDAEGNANTRLLKYYAGGSVMFSQAETYSLNTFALAQVIHLNYSLDGAAGVAIFNRSGVETRADLEKRIQAAGTTPTTNGAATIRFPPFFLILLCMLALYFDLVALN